jgi:hypothetical protein
MITDESGLLLYITPEQEVFPKNIFRYKRDFRNMTLNFFVS